MISLLLSAVIAAAPLATAPSFGILCKAEGKLGADNQLARFPKVRFFGVFLQQISNENIKFTKSFDPSDLLAGRSIAGFATSVGSKGYVATSGGAPRSIIVLYTAGPSGEFRDWKMAISPAKGDPSIYTVGTCMLMDGATEADFDQLTSSVPASK